MWIKNIIVGLIICISLPLNAQQNAKEKGLEAITEIAVKGQLDFLASDWTEGRETGTKGAYMATDYIASMFQVYGLKPGGDRKTVTPRRGMTREEYEELASQKTFFQNFNLLETWPGEEQELSVVTKNGDAEKSVDFNYRTDFSISGGSNGMSGTVPVVFIGYGLQDSEKGYDDLEGLDLKGKIVVKIPGYPGHKNPGSATHEKFKPAEGERNNRSSMMSGYGRGSRYSWAAEMGVLAVISYNPKANPAAQWADNDVYYPAELNGPPRGIRKPMRRLDAEPRGGNSINFTVTDKVIKEIVNGLELDFDALEDKIDKTGKPASMDLPGKYIRFKTTMNSRIVKARNVVGIIEGKKKDECIVLGAHFDHMGMRDGFIFNGSDANASGTVGIMTIAKAMMASGKQPEYTMVFCAWTAEEKGLIGSAYFADNPVIEDIKCYMNYDMISRVDPEDPNKNKCDFKYTNTVPAFKDLTVKHIDQYNYNLDMKYDGSERPVGGSDFSSFSRKGIPIFLLHGKFTPDYHAYTDHSDKAEIPYMTDIIKVGYLNLFELANNYKW